jgi:hypothetical protein
MVTLWQIVVPFFVQCQVSWRIAASEDVLVDNPLGNDALSTNKSKTLDLAVQGDNGDPIARDLYRLPSFVPLIPRQSWVWIEMDLLFFVWERKIFEMFHWPWQFDFSVSCVRCSIVLGRT